MFAYKKHFIIKDNTLVCIEKTWLKKYKHHSSILKDDEKQQIHPGTTFKNYHSHCNQYFLIGSFQLNPTVFTHNNISYSLIRCETDVSNWNESKFSYILNTYKDEFKTILNTEKIKFNINGKIQTDFIRKKDTHIIEDLKYFKTENNIVYLLANILLRNYPRIFRVCVTKLDIVNKEVKLVKILNRNSGEKMNNDEKNWVTFSHKNENYIITNLFPTLKIYKFDKDYNLHSPVSINTFDQIKGTHIENNLNPTYKDLYLTPCQNLIKLNDNNFLIICKKRTNNNFYKYYLCILHLPIFKITFLNKCLYEGKKLYLNSITEINGKIYKCFGVEDKTYKISNTRFKLNLNYWSKWNNFGDELSKYITTQLVNSNKYELVFNTEGHLDLVCIGSYIHKANNNSFIFGSGIRTKNNIEKNGHLYKNLNVISCRGPLTSEYIKNKGIITSYIFGDPALILPKFYKPIIQQQLKDKIGIVPHKTNWENYTKKEINNSKFYLINPTKHWKEVINDIYSCKAIISSSLHGLICSDAYNIPNLWLDEFKLQEGDFKFKDYFESQGRNYVKIKKISEYNENLLYKEGNKVNLDNLIDIFPFK